MWTVIYMAQSKDMASNIRQKLEDQGILVKIKPIGKDANGEDNCFEILVPAAEVEEAHNIIIDIGF